MDTTAPLYSTTTGTTALVGDLPQELLVELGLVSGDFEPEADFEDYDWPWCHVCSRPTDHRAEHDDLVEAGLASYDPEAPVVYRRS